MRTLLLALLLTACGDNEPACHEATQYKGAAVWCDGLPEQAICAADSATHEPMCRELCADEGDACPEGTWWKTQLVDGNKTICYCEPPPTAAVRETLDR